MAAPAVAVTTGPADSAHERRRQNLRPRHTRIQSYPPCYHLSCGIVRDKVAHADTNISPFTLSEIAFYVGLSASHGPAQHPLTQQGMSPAGGA